MVKCIWFCLMFAMSLHAQACTGSLVVFRGLNDVLDQHAVQQYAKHYNLCMRVFSWQQHHEAIAVIDRGINNYHLYGFSKGAESAMKVVQYVKRKPTLVVTVGAYKTTDVDFSKFNINFINIFDRSGLGQRSPGVFVDVPHYKAQQAANQILLK